MRKTLQKNAWVLICDLCGLALFSALLLGGTGTAVFAYLLFLAPILLLAGMALTCRRTH